MRFARRPLYTYWAKSDSNVIILARWATADRRRGSRAWCRWKSTTSRTERRRKTWGECLKDAARSETFIFLETGSRARAGDSLSSGIYICTGCLLLFVTCRRTVSRRRRLQKWLQYSCWARYKTMYCVHKSRTSPFIGSRFLFWWQYAMIQNFDLIWFAASRNDFDCTRDGIEIIVITSFYAYRFYDKRDAEDALDAMDGRMLDGRELRVQMARYGRPTSPYRRRRRRYDFPIYNYQIYFTP